MSERIDTPFTAEHFVAYCLRMVGHPYWYGTCGYKATKSLLESKRSQYPSHYNESRKNQYLKNIADKEVVCDCIGGAKGYAWTGGGQSILDAIGTDKKISSRYGSNGCPDKGANGMFEYAQKMGCAWGTISTLPEVPGVALYKEGHAGYYIGNGYAVEWQGYSYGCRKTMVSQRPWTHWYALPFIDYGDSIQSAPVRQDDTAATDYTLGSRSLSKGSRGTDVKTMQELLIRLDCTLPQYGADGIFGNETLSAVKVFQSRAGIKVDGVYGTRTHAALMAAVAEAEETQTAAGTTAAQGVVDTPEQSEAITQPKNVIIVTANGTVNIRCGNDMKYARITAVPNGTVLEWIATAANGWHAVAVNGQVGWVTGEYSKIDK